MHMEKMFVTNFNQNNKMYNFQKCVNEKCRFDFSKQKLDLLLKLLNL